MKCRCCNNKDLEQVLSYHNMPSIAQLLPTSPQEAKKLGIDLKVYHCHSCNLIQLDDNAIVPYFKDVIRSSNVSESMTKFRETQFANFSKYYSLSDRNYLEVGCGKGEYLEIMEKFISNSVGIENSIEAIHSLRSKNLECVKGFIQDDIDMKKGSFHAFGTFNFLEHIPRPVEFLRAIRTFLSSDAVGIIEVPNFDMMLKEHVYSDFSSEHLSYFTTETLTRVIEFSGFNVDSMDVIWHGHILSAKVSNRKIPSYHEFEANLNSSAQKILSILEKFPKEKVTVWGAGHQSLATISQLGLESYIGQIVDSAKQKQNRFSPSSALPIFSPEWLNEDNTELLLINVSSYWKEVNEIVRKKYNFIKYVFIVDNGRIFEV